MSEAEAPTYFFDTSALVKRYHREKGTDVVDAAFDRATTRWISDLGVIETYSAFARKVRTGEITEEDFRAATGAVAADIQRGLVRLVPLDEDEKGGRLADRNLRSIKRTAHVGCNAVGANENTGRGSANEGLLRRPPLLRYHRRRGLCRSRSRAAAQSRA